MTAAASSSRVPERLTVSEIQVLETKKIFFGHQSVGGNIVDGIRDLMATDPALKLKIVHSAHPESVEGPAFIESPIGENRNPRSKDEAFAEILARGMGEQGGIAMYKYCYIDIDAQTDVARLFASYKAEGDALKRKYPQLKIVHITIPLTVSESATDTKALLKTVLGRTTLRSINAKRNEFNRMLKQAYSGSEPVFDLAEAESTHRDGSRSSFTQGGQPVYSLARELASDDGHLNEAGRRTVATRLLRFLAGV